MTRFSIIQTDPVDQKENILEFWKEYLPGTPEGRFEWMLSNPAGPAIWFFAFNENNNELVGTISIMPREMIFNGKLIRAGIVGDYMVKKDYRVFGPALSLQKKVINSMSDFGIDYIYTIPNEASLQMNLRAGYTNAVKLIHFARPINTEHYLQKYINKNLSVYIGRVVDYILRFLSKESYIVTNGQMNEISSLDDSFNTIWNDIRSFETNLLGDHSINFIKWRYLNNPLSDFRIITFRSRYDNQLLGYIIFSLEDNRVEIYDILALNNIHKDRLIKELIKTGRREHCKSIYIRMHEDSSYNNNLRKFMFFNANDDMSVLAFGDDVSIFKRWIFTEGDRNI